MALRFKHHISTFADLFSVRKSLIIFDTFRNYTLMGQMFLDPGSSPFDWQLVIVWFLIKGEGQQKST